MRGDRKKIKRYRLNEIMDASSIAFLCTSILVGLMIVGLGWYILYKCFLYRFKIVREILGIERVQTKKKDN